MLLTSVLLSECPPNRQASPGARFARQLASFGGTTLKFAVGPVNLEANFRPAAAERPSKASVDVDSFLQEAETSFT